MNEQQSLRQGNVWLFTAVGFTLFALLQYFPWWLMLMSAGLFFWRLAAFFWQWHLPPNWLKNIIFLAAVLGVWRYYTVLMGPEAGVALLLTAFSFKLLELNTRRDCFVVAAIGYFLVASLLLQDSTLLTALISLFCVLLFTAGMAGQYMGGAEDETSNWQPLSKSFRFLLMAMPITIVLFVLVPRIPPLWSMPINQHAAKTGVGDKVSPGDIVNLSRSAETAFRVELLSGRLPDRALMYWRGKTLSDFDGRAWFSGVDDAIRTRRKIDSSQGNVAGLLRGEYRVTQKSSNQALLFSLGPSVTTKDTAALRFDGTWYNKTPITGNVVVDYFWASESIVADFPRKINYWLPPLGNPKTKVWAAKIREQISDKKERINFVLRHFMENQFSYTLQPAALGRESIDDFLFVTREGFCEHYASTLAYIARLLDVPSRVVVGYQGGAITDEGYWLVRQYDAHAWVELWLDGRWQMVDPTASIAPDRIYNGMIDLLSEDGQLFSDGQLVLSSFNWYRDFRTSLDYLDYLWGKWVVSYSAEDQSALLGRWIGKNDVYNLAKLLGGFAGIIILVVYSFGWYQKYSTRKPALIRAYQKLEELLHQKHEVPLNLPPAEMLERGTQLYPKQAKTFAEVKNSFDSYYYQDGDQASMKVAEANLAKQIFSLYRSL